MCQTRYNRRLLSACLLAVFLLFDMAVLQAEILNGNTPFLRIRLGSNGGTVDTVIYTPLIPTELGGLAGVTTQASAISTTAIAGASGGFRVRIVTDTNGKNGGGGGATAPLTSTFTYDSSSPMACTTPATCGATTINFSKISWTTRDNDTLNSVTQYSGGAAQLFQTQTDFNNANNGTNTRHRNYYRFEYLNDTLLPAGTYEGTVVVNGVAN